MARATRNDLPLAVAFIDVDRLKVVNDSQGHAAGDRLLRHVAHALKSRLRPYDLVIRYGGDEFLCVMDGLDAATATDRLATINVALRGLAAEASVSVGIADLRPGESAGDLVRRADEALYQARSDASSQAHRHVAASRAALDSTRSRTTGPSLAPTFRTQVTELRAWEAKLRLDLPGSVHGYRVASRRLRSTLSGFRPLFDAGATDELRAG